MTGNFEKVPKAERYICLPSDIFENVFSKRDSQASTESHFVSIAKGGGMINAGIRDGELIGKIKHLYNVFLEQWDTECKPKGFEVHDIRLGGLICRIEHCKNIILDYLKGKRADISPLNEDILLVMKEAEQGKGNIGFNSWLQTAMIKSLM